MKKRIYNKSTGRKYTGDSYDARYSRKTSADRTKRGAARAIMKKHLTKKYGAAKAEAMMKGKDVAHKKPISKGGSNALSNLKLQSKKANRGRANEGNRKKGKRGPGKKS